MASCCSWITGYDTCTFAILIICVRPHFRAIFSHAVRRIYTRQHLLLCSARKDGAVIGARVIPLRHVRSIDKGCSPLEFFVLVLRAFQHSIRRPYQRHHVASMKGPSDGTCGGMLALEAIKTITWPSTFGITLPYVINKNSGTCYDSVRCEWLCKDIYVFFFFFFFLTRF